MRSIAPGPKLRPGKPSPGPEKYGESRVKAPDEIRYVGRDRTRTRCHTFRSTAGKAGIAFRLDPGVAGSTPGTEISSGSGNQVSKAVGRLSPASEHGQLGLRDNHCAVRAGAHRDPFGPGPPVDLTPRLRRGFTRWPKVMACHTMRRDAGGQLARFDSFADSQASPQERFQLVQPHRVGTIGKSLVRIGMNLKEKRIAAGGDR